MIGAIDIGYAVPIIIGTAWAVFVTLVLVFMTIRKKPIPKPPSKKVG